MLESWLAASTAITALIPVLMQLRQNLEPDQYLSSLLACFDALDCAPAQIWANILSSEVVFMAFNAGLYQKGPFL